MWGAWGLLVFVRYVHVCGVHGVACVREIRTCVLVGARGLLVFVRYVHVCGVHGGCLCS